MQINTSFQNRSYQDSPHTHHITECLHEEQIAKKKAGGGAPAKSSSGTSVTETSEKDDDYINVIPSVSQKNSGKKGIGAVKGFWDALGDEGTENKKNVMTIFKENFLSGIYDAAAMMQEGFKHRVTDRIQTLREKVKVSAGNALGKFKKNRESFAALTENQTSSGRGKYEAKEKSSQGQVADAKTKDNIPVQIQPHNYLMDSYNRKGQYSQLNDNLTYQKPENDSGSRTEQ